MVQSLTLSNSTPTAGQSVTLRATVRNVGKGRSFATEIGFRLSPDEPISMWDGVVGWRPDTGHGWDPLVPALSPSGTSRKSITLPAGSTGYYGACVDPVPGESLATNNCSRGVPVTVQ